MFASALITFREGLEAALIVGIVLGYLARTGNGRRAVSVWAGVAAAVAVSVVAALGIQSVGASFEGAAEQVFEGTAMLLAAAVLTWMVFWMRRQSRGIKGSLEAGVHEAVTTGASGGLFLLAFVAVVREGLETALFISAALFTSTPAETLAGAALGLAAAVTTGWLLFAGARRLNLAAFFKVTGVLLVVFAAGLVSYGVHEFEEAGLLPPLVEHLWSTKALLDDKAGLGAVLRSLVGYFASPSLLQVLAYAGYVAAVGVGILRDRPAAEAQHRPTSAGARA